MLSCTTFETAKEQFIKVDSWENHNDVIDKLFDLEEHNDQQNRKTYVMGNWSSLCVADKNLQDEKSNGS